MNKYFILFYLLSTTFFAQENYVRNGGEFYPEQYLSEKDSLKWPLLFDISLKIPFDPLTSEEDYLIEDILQRQFQNGRLEYQKSFNKFDLYELSEEWKP